jgi:hypothetical protein
MLAIDYKRGIMPSGGEREAARKMGEDSQVK